MTPTSSSGSSEVIDVTMAEYAAREAAEVREAELEREYDWHVIVHLPARDDAVVLAEQLAAEGLPVRRRCHFVMC